MNYDFAMEHLQKLKGVLIRGLEEWENSEWSDNDISKEMIRTYRGLIQEVEEEIEAYANAKETGCIITREGREMIKKLKEDKQCDEDER